jgi:DNA polymerase-4
MAKALLRQVDISEAHPIRLLGLSVSHPPAAESFSSAQPVELELEFEDWPE